MPKIIRGKEALVVSEAKPGFTRQKTSEFVRPISCQVSELLIAAALNTFSSVMII